VTGEYVSQATLRDAILPILKGRGCLGQGMKLFTRANLSAKRVIE